MKKCFDATKYLKIQKRKITQRIKMFDTPLAPSPAFFPILRSNSSKNLKTTLKSFFVLMRAPSNTPKFVPITSFPMRPKSSASSNFYALKVSM